MKKEIRFCLPVGDYWFLSPHAPFSIEMNIDGKKYKFTSAEHYYQAMKFDTTDERFDKILSMKDSNKARLLTKEPEYRNGRRQGFDENRFDIMRTALVAVFAQNSKAMELLLSTADATLIKSCDVCYKCGFGEGCGKNILGKILMDIRDAG